MNRRDFAKTGALGLGALATLPSFNIISRPGRGDEKIIGHGDFTYRVHMDWCQLSAAKTPVINCHEMVIDKKGRLIFNTDEPKNNVIIMDKDGKYLDSWTKEFVGAHGLTLSTEGGEEFLWMTDAPWGGPTKFQSTVAKYTLDGKEVMKLPRPQDIGEYDSEMRYMPTETAVGPNGDIYVADGYGSQFVLQFSAEGEFIRKFGGNGQGEAEFETVHGVVIDYRTATPTLMCTSRTHNAFKRFSLDGEYLETIYLPGAFVCRPVIDDDMLYAGVCWSRLKWLNQTPDSGFVTILNKEGKVVSNPGGTAPTYENGELQLMVQSEPLFKHCHDVCLDENKNIYICQWNADQTFPVKLERV